ncbi:hypothetical protein DIS18_05355 [Algibacter marinivivus]|uniref:Fimbrial assembly protein (PilN) n=1 Tax=Algibacter marinivivus TaxID=2100723 RepID=A0A2U2X843_9FLAO|nr:hypothetical protein [Algibacter marinivivus]PWH83975.1 hypothetical protein DIS18_05355 [Algibacter marinivivus]
MLDNFWTYLQFGNRFCAVEHTSNEDAEVIYATLLNRSKKELNIESSFEEKKIEDLSNKLHKNQHIVLVLNNDKVLSKTIESEQQDSLKLVYKAFSNINLEDFYFEVLSQKNKHFIALCRKDYVNNLIEEYSKQNLSIINVSLGNNLIVNISEFIDKNRVYTSNSIIQFENNQVLQIEKDSIPLESYDINGLTISNNHLLSFSGALQTVLNSNTTKTNFSEEKGSLLNNYKQKRFFDQFLKIGGLFILGLLLINFFAFNHYFNKVNELKQVSEINQSTKNQIIKLNESVSKKQKTVDDLLKSNCSKSSFYNDRIINILPKSILLSEFNYQPLLKRIKTDKGIEVDKNSISISGDSNNSEVFSSYINQLEQEDWINKVDIINYGTTSSNTSNFKIKIVLNDE